METKKIIVTSCKGGVGKSTLTAIIAEELTKAGKKVGIVDSDIYGPSIAQIFGVSQKPEIKDNKLIPILSRGIELISTALIVDPESPLPFRGPLSGKILYQLIAMTAWGKIDYLLIDTPPGTSDIHLSLLQNYKIDGAILVTTPQKISEINVVKTISLYRKFNITIFGIIENMSGYYDLEKQVKIFTGNAGQNLSDKYEIPLIYKVPIDPKIAYNVDNCMSLNDIVYLNIKSIYHEQTKLD